VHAPPEPSGANDGRPGRRPWRVRDFENDSYADTEWTPQPSRQAGALHAPLSLVARRRLQMIDALASFAPTDAAHLQLQPRRQIDSRTLELLTPVSVPGSMER
jgi:hypothetical protein